MDLEKKIGRMVRLKRARGFSYGLCPFHEEASPSFLVWEDRYRCLVCGMSGRTPEWEAYLAGEDEEDEKPDRACKEAVKAAATFFSERLFKTGDPCFSYFASRGLTEKSMRAFTLGSAPPFGDQLVRVLRQEGFAEDVILAAGLAYPDKKSGLLRDRFYDRAVYTIRDEAGDVTGFGARILGKETGGPKYINSPESALFRKRKNLYGLDKAKASPEDAFILVEGYMDVIAMHEAGFTNAVASLGTALTKEQCRLLGNFGRSVVLLYDSDRAGQDAAVSAVKLLQKEGLEVSVASGWQAYGKDPDEVIKKHGRGKIREVVRRAEDGTAFLMKNLPPSEAVNYLLRQ